MDETSYKYPPISIWCGMVMRPSSRSPQGYAQFGLNHFDPKLMKTQLGLDLSWFLVDQTWSILGHGMVSISICFLFSVSQVPLVYLELHEVWPRFLSIIYGVAPVCSLVDPTFCLKLAKFHLSLFQWTLYGLYISFTQSGYYHRSIDLGQIFSSLCRFSPYQVWIKYDLAWFRFYSASSLSCFGFIFVGHSLTMTQYQTLSKLVHLSSILPLFHFLFIFT